MVARDANDSRVGECVFSGEYLHVIAVSDVSAEYRYYFLTAVLYNIPHIVTKNATPNK